MGAPAVPPNRNQERQTHNIYAQAAPETSSNYWDNQIVTGVPAGN
jgi:hypothetical protein